MRSIHESPMRALALLLVAGLLACSDADRVASQRPVQSRADWERFTDRLPDDPRAAATALEQYRRRHGLLLPFWPRDDAPAALTQGLTLHEHPCGESLPAFVAAIPHDDPVLEPELVLELDQAGRVIRRWHIPIDATVVAVQGDRVIVPAPLVRQGEWPGSVYLSVAPNGEYRVVANVVAASTQLFDCPPLSEFDSDYLGCWTFADAAGIRRIAYQSVCT